MEKQARAQWHQTQEKFKVQPRNLNAYLRLGPLRHSTSFCYGFICWVNWNASSSQTRWWGNYTLLLSFLAAVLLWSRIRVMLDRHSSGSPLFLSQDICILDGNSAGLLIADKGFLRFSRLMSERGKSCTKEVTRCIYISCTLTSLLLGKLRDLLPSLQQLTTMTNEESDFNEGNESFTRTVSSNSIAFFKQVIIWIRNIVFVSVAVIRLGWHVF